MDLSALDVSRFTRLRTLILHGVSSAAAATVQPNTKLPPSLQCLGLTSLHTRLFEVRPMHCRPASSVTCVTPRSLSHALMMVCCDRAGSFSRQLIRVKVLLSSSTCALLNFWLQLFNQLKLWRRAAPSRI